ncbi:MAG: DUF2914 domain-containing protein [Candidatus Marinimicrobia bacterium]|nr:DUF2914 domain-containing protein [Candidatus Neomarinimicrobiota bacterium]
MDSALLLVGVILLLLIGVAIWQKLYKGIPILIVVYFIYAGIKLTSTHPVEESKPELQVEGMMVNDQIVVIPEDTIPADVDTQIVIVPVDSFPIVEVLEEHVDELESEMILRRIVVCKEVSNERIPLGVDKIFPNDIGALFCFTAIENLVTDDSVTHTWYYNGREMATIDLEVGRSPFWRTWSIKSIQPRLIGDWQVVVFDSKGYQLGFTTFQIIERSVESTEQPEKVDFNN